MKLTALFILFALFLNCGFVFSEEEANSSTEAGAVCLTQDCPSNGVLQKVQDIEDTVLQADFNSLLCEFTSKQPECKGIDKNEIKGCLKPGSGGVVSALRGTGKGALQCVVGFYEGMVHFFTSTYKWIKGLFSDDEDPGLRTYLHAEFESASQDSGTTMSALKTAGSVLELLYGSMAEVYSCLNPIGVTKKVCQFIGNAPFSAMAGVAAGAVGTLLSATAIILSPVLPTTGIAYGTYKASKSLGANTELAVSASMSTGIVSALATMGYLQVGGAPAYVKAIGAVGRATTGPAVAITSSVLGIATIGPASHDKAVQERIKEKLKARVQEFKEQEEINTENRKRDR